MTFKCPICKKPVPGPAADQKTPQWFPFCSERCKLVDLGKWLDAEYTVPTEAADEDEDGSVSQE